MSPTSLTFTADNWNTPQTVTITSAEDSDYVRPLGAAPARGGPATTTASLCRGVVDPARQLQPDDDHGRIRRPRVVPPSAGRPRWGRPSRWTLSSIADAEGLTNASYTYLYQWLRNGAEIPEATDTSYTLVDADEGKTIKVKVSFTDDANNSESRTSAATVAVAPRPNSSPTGAPTINGTPQVRRTLIGRHIGDCRRRRYGNRRLQIPVARRH